MQIEKKETTNPFGKTSEVGYFKLQNGGYLALNNTIAGIFSIYAKCTSTGTINIGSDERTISTAWMRYIFYKIPLNCQVLFTQGEYFIYGAKLESGNKVTDWTAAPEDIQNQFTIITNTISGVSSKVDNVEKSIVNKVWQTDITSKINEYNNTTVKEIVDRVTKTETDINGVTTTVSTMKTNYDGQITSLETKQIQTDSKLGWLISSGTSSSNFTLTDRTADLVSKYINLHGLVTFKGLSSDVNGKFTKYDGWGGTTDSTKINGAMIETGSIKAEQIAANAITAIKIATNAVTADKISAYGLSVLHKTTGEKTLEIDASGNVNLNVNSLQIASKDVPTKTEVTQSIKDLQIGGRNLLLNSNFLNGTFGWTAEDNCKIAASPSDTLKEKNAYVLIIANTGTGRAYNNSRTDKYHLAKTQYTLQFKYKTDDSSPVTFKVGVADTRYIIGNITAPADNTWRKFTATYTAPMTGSLTIRITSGTGRILIGVPKLEYGNKATDWSPAPEDLQDDATTKANNALASAKTYADAQIKVTADGINQNVTKKFDDLQIGGRNLILNGKGDKKAGFFKNFTTVTDEYSEFTLTSQKTYVNIDIGGGFLLGCRDYTVGEQVTWSYDIMYTAWNFPSGTYHNELWMGQRYTNALSGETATGTWTVVTAHGLPVVGQYGCELNKWFHVKKTLTIPEQASSNVGTATTIQFYNSNANVAASFTARLKNVKLERGNVATDWTPAPEDLATADNVNDKLAEVRKEINSNIEQTGEAIKSSVYEKVYLKDDVDSLLSYVNTEVEQTKTSWQVTFNQLVKQLNDYSDGSDAAFDEIRKYIRFEDGNILLGNSSSPLILRIRNDRIQFLQNGYEVAYISDQRMYNTTCEIISQLRIADSAWTVEHNASGDTVISLVRI